MKKFQYVITLDLDDDSLKQLVKDHPEVLDGIDFNGVPEEDLPFAFAKAMTEPMEDALCSGMGQSGNSKIKVDFGGAA